MKSPHDLRPLTSTIAWTFAMEGSGNTPVGILLRFVCRLIVVSVIFPSKAFRVELQTELHMTTIIIEGICSTKNADGSVNLAPMGPVVDRSLSKFHFRPFQTSTTFQNLKRDRCGVFHVIDDVLLFARLVTNTWTATPEMFPAMNISGSVLENCCRWYEFEVLRIDDSRGRSEIETRTVNVGQRREFWGFNRAKHAVLEAAILVTRLHLLSQQEVQSQLRVLAGAVEKTGGRDEHCAFHLLTGHAERYWSGRP